MFNLNPERELIGFLIRHGELNIDNKWDGWGAFVLSDKGRESAEKAAQWLGFDKIGRVIASDLPRTMQTAEYIMNDCDVSCPYLGSDPNLRAWAIGDFTGKEKTDERKKEFQHYRDNPDVPIPGGESFDQFCERVKVVYQYLSTPYNQLPSVLVIHNSVLKALMGLDEKGDVVLPGGIVAVYIDSKGECSFEIEMGGAEDAPDASFGCMSSCG